MSSRPGTNTSERITGAKMMTIGLRHVSIYQVQRQILQAESKEDYSHVGRERASQFGENIFVKSLIAEILSR